ncbi:glycosyltransferase family 2 protein [Arcicella rigui]|uniref:Glycosyltransferase family 2 protein n=1 Tax=Arcicella rigui TaxID=797020 RepID=A0ABU5QF63_9BACT|nr:glycosyltransferase family 2 protein [Arcicella rigui]MEA5141187.1 glycosyltransferase family 2 protein [Arcicella rigui]
MDYKVTIIIPIYNVELFIERCLLSAFNQSFNSIEYLLINDRGSDKSIEIAKKIVESHPRKCDIKFINHPYNIGLGATRNTGIDNAKGEYVYFLDSDDTIPTHAIEKLYEVASNEKVDVVVGSYTSVDFNGNNQKWEWIFSKNIIRGEYSVGNFFLHGGYYVMIWNKLYNTEFLRKNKIYCIPESLNEDVFFSIQVALTAQSLGTIKDITYLYTFRKGSIMYTFIEKNILDYIKTIVELIRYSKEYRNTIIYNRFIYYIYGLRFTLLKKINSSMNISVSKKKDLSKQAVNIQFLSFVEIWALKNVLTIHKAKFSMSFMPYRFQLFFLDSIEYGVKSLKNILKTN